MHLRRREPGVARPRGRRPAVTSGKEAERWVLDSEVWLERFAFPEGQVWLLFDCRHDAVRQVNPRDAAYLDSFRRPRFVGKPDERLLRYRGTGVLVKAGDDADTAFPS